MRTLALPASFTSTHDTSGLAGFPAVDVFGAAGTPVLAPVSGRMVDVHMIPWNVKKRVGGETAYLQGDNGKTYFLTHLAGNVPSDVVQAGQPIGVVGTVPGGAWASHVHEGVYQGTYNPGGSSTQPSVPSVPQVPQQPSPGAAATPLQVIRDYAPRVGLDPIAVIAYALTQGGTSWGAVGDNGSSFGPFQMHIGGAAGNRSPQEASAWANSPQGLIDGMNMMAHAGATGKSGPEAAAFIVGPSFGRGANPTSDMAKARAAYPQAATLLRQYPAPAGGATSLGGAGYGPGPSPPTQPAPPTYVNPNVPVATAPPTTDAATVPLAIGMSPIDGKSAPAARIPKLIRPAKKATIGEKIAEQAFGAAPIAPANVRSKARVLQSAAAEPADAGGDVLSRLLNANQGAAPAAIFTPNPAPAGTTDAPAVHLEAKDATTVPDLPKVLQLAKMHALDSYAGFTTPSFHRFLETAEGRPAARHLHGQLGHGRALKAPRKRALLFFGKGHPSHSGISLGGHHFVHGTNGGRTIQVSSLRQEPYASSLLAIRG